MVSEHLYWLERISHFPDNDALIIRRGMYRLAMAMISDRVHDAAKDREMGKMNPVERKTRDPEVLLKFPGDSVYPVDCPEMDAIMDPDTIVGFRAV